MALLTKKILPRGRYRVASNRGRIWREFDEATLSKVAENTNKMIAAGLKIPAPFKHRKDAIPRTQEQWDSFEKEIEVNKPADPLVNSGYWTRFWVAPDERGRPSLFGEVDAPGDKDQENSMAWKLDKVNKEVSASITENFEDGLGRTWTDSLLHVAIVNHAVVPEQLPFEDSVTVVNMSMEDSENSEEGTISELVTALKTKNITLPSSTNSKTFFRDLLIALLQDTKVSNGDDLTPAPIYMSTQGDDMALTEAQAKALVDTKAVNPATNKPFTMEDFGFKAVVTPPVNLSVGDDVKKLQAENEKLRSLTGGLVKYLATGVKANLTSRIQALLAKGFDKEYIEKQLMPQVATVDLSINPDGTVAPHPLETTLSALEAMPAPKASSPFGGHVEPNPLFGGDSDVTDSAIDAILDKMVSEDGATF